MSTENLLYEKRFIFHHDVTSYYGDMFYNKFNLKSISVDFDTKYIDMSVKLIIGSAENTVFFPTPNNRVLKFEYCELIIVPFQNFAVEINYDEFNCNSKIYVSLKGVLTRPVH